MNFEGCQINYFIFHSDFPPGRKISASCFYISYHKEIIGPPISEGMRYLRWPYLWHTLCSHLHCPYSGASTPQLSWAQGTFIIGVLMLERKISTQYNLVFCWSEWVTSQSNQTDCEPIFITTKGRDVRSWDITSNPSFDCIYAFTREKAEMCQLL